MYLPDSLLWCFYPECDLSGVKIYCEDNIRSQIISDFKELFWANYYEGVRNLMSESLGEDEENDEFDDEFEEDEENDELEYEFGEAAEPIGNIDETDYGIFIHIGNLSIFDTWGTGDNYLEDSDALEKTLANIYSKYPNIKIEGYVGYCWSDVHSGEVVQYNINYPQVDNQVDTYDFIGKKLNEVFMDNNYLEEYSDQFSDLIAEEAEDFIEIITNHRMWISNEAIENLMEKFEDEEDFVDELGKLLERDEEDE